ncbi:MAG: hypothetical protein WBB42_10705 [Polyangiales bacterium]
MREKRGERIADLPDLIFVQQPFENDVSIGVVGFPPGLILS